MANSSSIESEFIEEAFRALSAEALGLFQARKLGIRVHVPDQVREKMVAAHGPEAHRVLSLLDGSVDLSFPNGIAPDGQATQGEGAARTRESVFDGLAVEGKLRQLDAIRRTVQQFGKGYNPRESAALLCNLLAFGVLAGVEHFDIGLWEPSWLRAFAGAALIAVVYYCCSKRPKSVYEQWESLMADYDPVDKGAYRRLQETAKRGALEVYKMNAWIACERSALMDAAGRVSGRPHNAFEDKIV